MIRGEDTLNEWYRYIKKAVTKWSNYTALLAIQVIQISKQNNTGNTCQVYKWYKSNKWYSRMIQSNDTVEIDTVDR